MADNILTPEQAAQLQEAGHISPELAGQFIPQVEAPIGSSLDMPIDPSNSVMASEIDPSNSIMSPEADPTNTVMASEIDPSNTVLAPQPINPATNLSPEDEALQSVTAGIPGVEDAIVSEPVPEKMTSQQKFDQIKKELEAKNLSSFAPGASVTDEQVLEEMDQRESETLADTKAAKDELDSRIAARRNHIAKMEARGLTAQPDPELDAIIAEKDAVLADPSQDEVAKEMEPLKQAVAQEKAAEQVVLEEQDKEARKKEAVAKSIEKEDEEAASIDPNRYWNNKSTGQKLLAGLALALGGFGAGLTGGRNHALDIINKEIDADLNAQKLDRDTFLAKKQQAFKMLQHNLNVQNSRVTNQATKAKIVKTYADLEAGRQNAMMERQRIKMLRSGKGLNVNLLSEKEKDRVVRMPSGEAVLADNKFKAEKLSEFMSQNQPAVQAIEDVLHVATTGSKFNLTDRVKIATKLSAAIGNLRIPITGPGVMTDTEREFIKGVLGDPNKIMALKSLEVTKLKTVFDKLHKDADWQHKNAGIKNFYGENQKSIEHLRKKNPGTGIHSLIESLKRKGKWK
jgi:hypothetical protein